MNLLLKALRLVLANHNRQIYCDVDGVLADFRRFALEYTGTTKYTIKDLPEDVYYQLKPMPDAFTLWEFIKPYSPFILTALPRQRTPEKPTADKKKWLKEYFDIDPNTVYVTYADKKKYFAKDGKTKSANILIDDLERNIHEWRMSGGIGILHTSAQKTINELKRLGF